MNDKNNHARYTHTFDFEMCGLTFKKLGDLETNMHTCDEYEFGTGCSILTANCNFPTMTS